ncbi:hypothetical protein [Flavobacterium luminosum]|uniref:Uncharacterized protein n=1 Tax=Flavobacterium luminosum TaxID=2949086 RepID=A0ABT0TPK9_9FLAO|nr:hypothetical protein [Flavobacterium sp. HXWNR70]MCL9809420.1 hypothetical protein [Flavobacterium sp. HXWNR70]
MAKETHVDSLKYQPQATTGKLLLGLLFDAIGMLTYAIPLLGETLDIVWAPVAGIVMSILYKGTVGKVSGVIAFIEELIPGLDFIPTFTITWMYEYFQDRKHSK